MAYIVKKKKKNKIYYYLAVSARVNGKPRIISRKYLGSAEKIAQAVKQETRIPQAEFSTVLDLGAVLALFDISERLNIRGIVEHHVFKREQGLDVSDSILLAAINRAVMPTSKNSFYEWFQKTVLHSCFREATSQGFWNNMAQLDQKSIRVIEDDITKVVVKKYKITTECLLFDNTIFFTYINTDNPATLAKRGHSKEKRSDLKIIGLSLMVSPDNNVPLFHETYPGNTNDAKRFSEVIEQLKQRYKNLGIGDCIATLVFDRGNNSEDNIEDILSGTPLKFHFVGGLKLSQCLELLNIPISKFTKLDSAEFKQTAAYRVEKFVFGGVSNKLCNWYNLLNYRQHFK
jgi:transposase